MKLIRSRQILIPLDLSSESWKAFLLSVSIAQQLALKLTILYVIPTESSTIVELLRSELFTKNEALSFPDLMQRRIEETAKKVLAEHPALKDFSHYQVKVVKGTPATEIVREIKDRQPDISVLTCHSRSELVSLFIGGTAERVIRESVRPVLTLPAGLDINKSVHYLRQIKKQPRERRPVKSKARLLLTTDFSEPSLHALNYAIELCQLLPAELYVLHVVEKFPMLDLTTLEQNSRLVREKKEKISQFLAQELGTTRLPSIKITVNSGTAEKEILAVSKAEHIDMIIMGTQGKQWLERLLVGSTTEAVVMSAPCPVLTVRGPKKADIIEQRYQEVKKRISSLELQTSINTDVPLAKKGAKERILIKEDPFRNTHLFLGYYTPEGVVNGLKKYGIAELLHKRGYEHLCYIIDTRNPYHQQVKIYSGMEEDPDMLLIEFALHEESRPATSLMTNCENLQKRYVHYLIVDWVMAQHVAQPQFSERHPRLPGQTMRGLGMGFEIFGLFAMIADRLGKDGILSRPEYYHNAFLYHEKCRFLSPEMEAVYLAVTRDTAEYSLAEVSWAIEKGYLLHSDDGSVFRWQGEDLVFPRSSLLNEYFGSSQYMKRVKEGLESQRYYVDWDAFQTIKETLLVPRKGEE